MAFAPARVVLAVVIAMLLFASAADAAPRPNILVILVDDMGYDSPEDAIGGPGVATPSLAALADRGVRMSNAYSVAPVCAPSRAGLLTGRYPQRDGFENNQPPGEHRGVPRLTPILAERLSAAGYSTGMIGKWHLGSAAGLRPWERGFDDFYGFLPAASRYVHPTGLWRTTTAGTAIPASGADVDYLTDSFAAAAADFIRRQRAGRPWFLYLAFNALHTPLQAPARSLSRVQHIADPKRRAYAAMLSALDEGLGVVQDELRATGQDANTLIWFQSDNGGALWQGATNTPLRGGKATVWEGGLRVQTYLSYPPQIASRQRYDGIASGLDLVPTVLAAAGLPQPIGLDGDNLLPQLAGTPHPDRALIWRVFGGRTSAPTQALAVRQGRWKLVEQGNSTLLFDLASDPGESSPIIEQPAVIARLRGIADSWERQMRTPLWCCDH